MLWMPESPKFLIANKRFTEAREVFTWIGKKNGLKLQLIQERLANIEFEGEKYHTRGKQKTMAQKYISDEDKRADTLSIKKKE